ncbi:HNH endonuclease [Serratia rhizosphaerae]|uniref:HNH endonuclease n=1 Tax=Serratia rhizosphaerae TaxID=2597702 RepID=A0ABX6GUQ3_9GAMM|nr:HNH endonuclease [Serratia rhizosphaerae]
MLAAGGIYNQNVEGFAETAKQLGGEAADGFSQVANPQSIGSLIALSSIVAVAKLPNGNIANIKSLEELQHYLGTYKKQPTLLNNIDVLKMSYIKRPMEERNILRKEFDNKVRRNFLKSISNDKGMSERFNPIERSDIASGRPPKGWSVHHKLPLDDSGTNDFSNLTLISNSEHAIFTTTQRKIVRGMSLDESKDILWPVPKGKVYP